MQVVERIGNFNPAQLMDELIQQVATFRRVTDRIADPDMGTVEGTDDSVVVTFADDIPAVAVNGVLDSHVPIARPLRDWAAELVAVDSLETLKTFIGDYLRVR